MLEIMDWCPEQPDILSLVDADIREVFEGKGGYLNWTPLMAQLCKEMRLLRESIRDLIVEVR